MRYTLQAGRSILRDGARFVSLNRADECPPTDADQCAEFVTHALNLSIRTATLALLVSAPNTWERRADEMSARAMHDATRDLDALIEGAARLRAYLDWRERRTLDHAGAVKSSNKLANAVRKLLGYTYPSTLSF